MSFSDITRDELGKIELLGRFVILTSYNIPFGQANLHNLFAVFQVGGAPS